VYETAVRITSNPAVYFALCLVIALGLAMTRVFYPWTSPFDEHTHLSYVQYAYSRIIPADGYQMNWWAKQAFSCHPHAMYGAMTPVPCGSLAPGRFYPTGGTNTSATWPPLYFMIVGVLMRIPMLWIHDPLYAARFITAILWSTGAAWLAFQSWKLTKVKTVGFTIAGLLVALPTFFYFTSNVSPHSLNTLLFASGLFISTRIVSSLKARGTHSVSPTWRASWLITIRTGWLYALIPLGFLCSIAIPQSLILVAVCTVFVVAWIFSEQGISWRVRTTSAVTTITTGFAILLGELGFFRFWQWQLGARAISFASGVNTSGGNTDPADPTYSSFFDQAVARWWSFWPNGLNPGWPDHQYATVQVTLWTFILGGLSLCGVALWRRGDWLGPLMLTLLITAPLFSIAYDVFFSTDVPARYGMLFPIIGVLAVANRHFAKPFRIVLLVLTAGTYIWALWLENPFYFPAANCHLGAVTHLIYCYQ
jgi:hypothetical protein